MDNVLSGWNGISQPGDVPQVILCFQQFPESSALVESHDDDMLILSVMVVPCILLYQ